MNLEILEATFYGEGLALFNDTAFTDVGFSPDIRGRFNQIWEHELTHVALLQGILGDNAPDPCNYTLYVFLLRHVSSKILISRHSPFSDARSFAALSQALEEACLRGILRVMPLWEEGYVVRDVIKTRER